MPSKSAGALTGPPGGGPPRRDEPCTARPLAVGWEDVGPWPGIGMGPEKYPVPFGKAPLAEDSPDSGSCGQRRGEFLLSGERERRVGATSNWPDDFSDRSAWMGSGPSIGVLGKLKEDEELPAEGYSLRRDGVLESPPPTRPGGEPEPPFR